jgi:hypothetical protein
MDIETIKAIGEYIVLPIASFTFTGIVIYILYRNR